MSLQIHGLEHRICHAEAVGLSKCFAEYAEHWANDYIMEIGFNPNSGYVYIALEDEMVSICSCIGQDIEYLATNFNNGEEEFFDSYHEYTEWLDAGGWGEEDDDEDA
jgi:hypothetical protein